MKKLLNYIVKHLTKEKNYFLYTMLLLLTIRVTTLEAEPFLKFCEMFGSAVVFLIHYFGPDVESEE